MIEALGTGEKIFGPSFHIDERLTEPTSAYDVSIDALKATSVLVEAGVPKSRLHELSVFIAPKPESRMLHFQGVLGRFVPKNLSLYIYTERVHTRMTQSPTSPSASQDNSHQAQTNAQHRSSHASPLLEQIFRHEAKHAGDYMNTDTIAPFEHSVHQMKRITNGARALAVISGATLLDGIFRQKHRIPRIAAGAAGLSGAMKIRYKAYTTSPHEVRARNFAKQTSEDPSSPAISLRLNTKETISQSNTPEQSLTRRVVKKGLK